MHKEIIIVNLMSQKKFREITPLQFVEMDTSKGKQIKEEERAIEDDENDVDASEELL